MSGFNYVLVTRPAMENFVVAAVAAKPSKRTRRAYSDDVIAAVVVSARHVGAANAAAQENRGKPKDEWIPEETVGTWLKRWRKEGNFWETERKKRGRPNVFTSVAGAHTEWERQVDALRGQGESVTARTSAVVARAVLSEKAPSVLEKHGGVMKMCLRTGARMLTAAGKSFRKGTTSRILPPQEALEGARDKFYGDLRDAFPEQTVALDMVLNFDQTMQLYSPNRGYTWEKRGADRVQIKSSKDGFTLLPVVSAVGVVGAQMIFGGTTPAVFPRLDPGPHLRYACTTSHWSDEQTTVALWRDIILPYVAAKRLNMGDPHAPAIVLADAYAAHWAPLVMKLVAEQQSIAYVAVPDSLTHLFQPLDLGIIAAIKQTVLRRKDEFMEQEVTTAIRENRTVLLSKSRPVLREKITLWIKEALADPIICAEKCCRAGFDRAGVLRVLVGSQMPADVDRLVAPPVCMDCGELGQPCTDVPNCVHFVNVDTAMMCAGCIDNHNTLCEQLD